MRIVVLSSFWLNGASHAEGDTLDVAERLGHELIGANKAAKAPEVTAEAASAATDAPAPALRPRRRDTSKEIAQ